MPTKRPGCGGPTSSGMGSLRPSASVAGQGVQGLIAAKFVWANAVMLPSSHAPARIAANR